MSEPLYFAGIGCRRGCSEISLRMLLQQSLAASAIPIGSVCGIASIDSKQNETGLLVLAQELNIPLHFFTAQQLRVFADHVDAGCAMVQQKTGTPNIAEACALALAQAYNTPHGGQYAELIIRKHKNADATFALAVTINRNASEKT